MTGRKPKPPDERLRDKERSKTANTTDPDSRVTSSANGGSLQGYTGQAIATDDQITIACGLTNEATDFKQLQPMVEQAAGNLEGAEVGESVAIVTADAGYLSKANLALEDETPSPKLVNLSRSTPKWWSSFVAALSSNSTLTDSVEVLLCH